MARWSRAPEVTVRALARPLGTVLEVIGTNGTRVTPALSRAGPVGVVMGRS